MDNYSLSDIKAATDGNETTGSWFWIVVLFLFMFGFGGRGFGNNYEPATAADVQRGFDTNGINNKLNEIGNGICNAGYENAQLINGLGGTVNTGFSNTIAAINNLGYQTQSCCCETNRNIDSVRYDNSQNTCEITTAIHQEGEATRALINSNTMQNLRDRLGDKDRELQTANFQLSQQAQSANIIGTLRPFPQPAYITCSPYQSTAGTYGCPYCA